MSLSVDTFRAFVSRLAARPGMWIGPSPTVRKFAAAIAGYEAALRDADVLPGNEPIPSWQFGQWLATQWHVSSVVGWETHVAERFGDDEAGIAEAAKLMAQWFLSRDDRP